MPQGKNQELLWPGSQQVLEQWSNRAQMHSNEIQAVEKWKANNQSLKKKHKLKGMITKETNWGNKFSHKEKCASKSQLYNFKVDGDISTR